LVGLILPDRNNNTIDPAWEKRSLVRVPDGRA
jgi:hypothetical protein